MITKVIRRQIETNKTPDNNTPTEVSTLYPNQFIETAPGLSVTKTATKLTSAIRIRNQIALIISFYCPVIICATT